MNVWWPLHYYSTWDNGKLDFRTKFSVCLLALTLPYFRQDTNTWDCITYINLFQLKFESIITPKNQIDLFLGCLFLLTYYEWFIFSLRRCVLSKLRESLLTFRYIDTLINLLFIISAHLCRLLPATNRFVSSTKEKNILNLKFYWKLGLRTIIFRRL